MSTRLKGLKSLQEIEGPRDPIHLVLSGLPLRLSGWNGEYTIIENVRKNGRPVWYRAAHHKLLLVPIIGVTIWWEPVPGCWVLHRDGDREGDFVLKTMHADHTSPVGRWQDSVAVNRGKCQRTDPSRTDPMVMFERNKLREKLNRLRDACLLANENISFDPAAEPNNSSSYGTSSPVGQDSSEDDSLPVLDCVSNNTSALPIPEAALVRMEGTNTSNSCEWSCQACTFLHANADTECIMCGTPRAEEARPFEGKTGMASAVRGTGAGELEPPDGSICPITDEIMEDPVICCDGHSYDRNGIEQWLATHTTSPLTGAELESKQVVPNHALRKVIQEWLARQA